MFYISTNRVLVVFRFFRLAEENSTVLLFLTVKPQVLHIIFPSWNFNNF